MRNLPIYQSPNLPMVLALVLVASSPLSSQELQIGIIDFYGLNRVTLAQAREAITFKEGDSLSYGDDRPLTFTDSECRLLKVPGVIRAHTEVVCCDDGRVIVYVGIQERGAPTMRLRAEQRGKARLADDVVAAGDEFSKTLGVAVLRGEANEDRSKGHSLLADPATRAIQ